MARFGDFDQYLDNAGDPLVSGKIYFYESGTTTFKTTYADVNNSIPNTNPVILTAAGRQPNVFFDGVAKAILTNSSDVQIAVRDPVGQTESAFGDQWVATKIYNATDVVLGSNGVFYRSLTNGNQNNNPVSTSGFWTLLYSVEWNAGITYASGAMVTYNDLQYQSLQGTNLNQNPATQTAYWVPLNFAWLSTSTYALDQNVVGTDGILYTSLQATNLNHVPASSPTWWVGTSAAAAASATAAAGSATAAAASETAAATSETNAAASETAAAASETAAAASETAAATSETNAATSASNAATSETNAAASETAAASSASAASTSETNAASSASAASTSETNAAASETAAAASETAAAGSATAAATSETNAASSASSASTSASNASTSETNAAASATAAAGSETAAAGSATAAAGSATSAAATLVDFEELYLGEKASDPTVDNQGGALVEGALYFNTTSNVMKVYDGSAWVNVAPVATSVTVSQISDYTGTATTLNYTSNLSSDAQTQLDSAAVYPTQTGNSGKFLTTDGSSPSWAAAGATQFGDDPLTYSAIASIGGVSVDAFELDSDRELVITSSMSCIVYNKTTSTWGTDTVISSGDIYLGAVLIATDTVLIAYATAASTTLRFRVLTFSGTTVTVNTEYTSTITAIYAINPSANDYYGHGLFDCATSYVLTYRASTGAANQQATTVTVSGTVVTVGAESTIETTAQNLWTVSPADGYVTFASNDGTNFSVHSYSVSGTTLTLINSASYANALEQYYYYSYLGKTSGNHFLYRQRNASGTTDLIAATFDVSYNVTIAVYVGFLSIDPNYSLNYAAIFDDSNNALVLATEGATSVNTYSGSTTSVGTSLAIYNANYAYRGEDAFYVGSGSAARQKVTLNSGAVELTELGQFYVPNSTVVGFNRSNGASTTSLYALYNATKMHLSNGSLMYSSRTGTEGGISNTINSDGSIVFSPLDNGYSARTQIVGVTDAKYTDTYNSIAGTYNIKRMSL